MERSGTSPEPRAKRWETKPTDHSEAPAAGLTYRQLAAARWLVRGRGNLDIAQRLGVARHTVERWKRLPAFIAGSSGCARSSRVRRVPPDGPFARHLAAEIAKTEKVTRGKNFLRI
jgi:FixJ family two-component response regulator